VLGDRGSVVVGNLTGALVGFVVTTALSSVALAQSTDPAAASGDPVPTDPVPMPTDFEPVPEAPPLAPAARTVTIGADLGYALLTAGGRGSVSYEPGLAWGGHVRIELRPWLGLRLSALNSRHAVHLASGALSTPDATALDGVTLHHPPLDVWRLGARIEPTWVATSRLRLWGGPGAEWVRVETDGIDARLGDCSEQCELATAKRSGSAVQLLASVGVTLDVIQHWVAASLAVSGGGFVGQPAGPLFDSRRPMQGFVAGSMLHLAALPRLGAAGSMVASVDFVF
jgi:hypothetical protein